MNNITYTKKNVLHIIIRNENDPFRLQVNVLLSNGIMVFGISCYSPEDGSSHLRSHSDYRYVRLRQKRFLSLEFFIDIILPAAQWPWS